MAARKPLRSVTSAKARDAEDRRNIHELTQIQLQEQFAGARERSKFIIEYATLALKGLTLINGGAIVALFTLLAKYADDLNSVIVLSQVWLWVSFAGFALGLVLTAGANVAALFSQYHHSEAEFLVPRNAYLTRVGEPTGEPAKALIEHEKKMGFWRRTALALGVASLAMFIAGSGCALYAAFPASHQSTSTAGQRTLVRQPSRASEGKGPDALRSIERAK